MKTKFLLFYLLCQVTISFGQVPSININTTKSRGFSNEDKRAFENLTSQEKKLKDEIKKLKPNETETKTTKETELTSIKSQKQTILQSNYQYIINKTYYDNQIAKVKAKIDKLKSDLLTAAKDDDNRDRINNYESEIKKLDREKERLVVEQNRKLDPAANNYSWRFPSIKKEYRNAFFEDTYNNSTDKTNFLNAFSVVGNPNGVLGQSEIIADNMAFLRVTFGTVISASNDSLTDENTKVEALQRLINGGGNFYLDFTLPLVTTIKGNTDDEIVNFYAFANLKAASDIKGYGNNIEASTYNTSLGLNCYGDISTDNKKFNFFMIANANYYYFSTEDFYKNIGIDHKNGFLCGKITIGVTLINQFRISANILTYGSEPSLRNEKIGVGLQFLPKI